MFFRFTGDYTGKRTSITLFGVTFEGREPADVTDADGIRRLSNHPEFEKVTKAVTPETREEWADRFEKEEKAIVAESIGTPFKKRGRPRKDG